MACSNSLIESHGVPAEHGYEYRNAWMASSNMPQSASVVYRFALAEANQALARLRDGALSGAAVLEVSGQ